MTIDPALQRRILGRFATGITLVTTRYGEGDDQIWGMTANSFTSLSLDPALVLLTVDRRNSMCEYMAQGQCFAVNVLTTHQESISRRFAMRGLKDFSDIELVAAETGAPILVGALSYLDCRLVETRRAVTMTFSLAKSSPAACTKASRCCSTTDATRG